MPNSQSFPFRRIAVDHLVEGGSRVWWQLFPTFRDGGPLTFQLQAGKTGLPDATDWINVGGPVIDGFLAVDDIKRVYGKRLETHYRVVLTDSTGTKHVSHPAPTEGMLDERNWVLAREIIRKFNLTDQFVAAEGWLLKRRRYGPACTRCLDSLTKEITDSYCPLCKGTGILIGYHPPVRLCLKLETETIQELRNGAQPPGQQQPSTTIAHLPAFPQIALEDIWVMDHTDLRFAIDVVKHTAAMRGVPLLSDITMHQLPFTDIAYKLQVGGEADPHDEMPGVGTGSVAVDHNYGGPDNYAYQVADGCGIEGATILFFRKADYQAGYRTAAFALASTFTTANGRWVNTVNLDPGDYIMYAEKVGEFGPDATELIVLPPGASNSLSSSNSDCSVQGFINNFGDF